MTYQPPPPPPPGPGGPPPGQWGGHARPGFDPKSVNPLDWAVLGIGAILFIFSFFAYYSFSFGGYEVGGYKVSGFSESFSAWHFSGGTFIGWFAMLLGVLAAAALALQLFVPAVSLPMNARLLSMCLFAASFVLYVIGLFAMDVDLGDHGFSYWLSLVLAAGGAVLALMRAQQTGTALPGPLAGMPNIGAMGPGGTHGGTHGGGQPPMAPPAGPPPGYAPPPPGYAPPPPAPPTAPPPPPPGY